MPGPNDRPPPQTRELDLHSAVLRADANWYAEYSRVPFVTFSNGKTFYHWWQASGPYASPPDT